MNELYKPGKLDYLEIDKILQESLQPKQIKIAKRFRFYK